MITLSSFMAPLPPAQATLRNCNIAVGALMVFLLGLSFIPHEQGITAEGPVVPAERVSQIQNMEGGVVTEILVHEGDEVKAGQLLVKLSPILAGAQLAERQSSASDLRAKVARLRAAISGEAMAQASNAEDTPFFEREKSVLDGWRSTRSGQQARVNAISNQVGALNETLSRYRQGVAQGAIGASEVSEVAAKVSSASGELAMARSTLDKLSEDARRELADAESKLRQTTSGSEGLQDRVSRTDVVSPVAGTVKSLNVNSIGSVVKPNETVVEVVPASENLIVEARVRPSDIRGIKVNMPARVSLSAFELGRNERVTGKVTEISADTLVDEAKRGRGDDRYFRVRVKTDTNMIGQDRITSGMQGTVFIVTGMRSTFSYVMDPIVRVAQTAGRER